MFIHSHWLHVNGWSKEKVKIIVFYCHLFFYRLWHVRSSIHPSLNIIWDFCPDANENRLWYTHIHLYFTFFSKVKCYYIFIINTINLLLKTFHFQRRMLWEYIEIIFESRFRVFYWLFLLFGSVMKSCVFVFGTRSETRSFV